MRTDENLGRRSFRHSNEWRRTAGSEALTPEIDRRLQGGFLENGRYVVHSLSGGERNRYFSNRGGKTFDDLSLLSGLDNPADGRGFALLDYNRDGRLDIALVNANIPKFNLYRNQIDEAGRFIAMRFEGGNRTSEATTGLACRDGYGALVTVDLGDRQLVREHRCGDGFAIQNSTVMLIGIGESEQAERVTVRWPSGKTGSMAKVRTGSLVVAMENGVDAEPTFRSEPYGPAMPAPAGPPAANGKGVFPLAAAMSKASGDSDRTDLRIFTTTATWCAACISHLPELQSLRSGLIEDRVELIGLPVDPEDDTDKLLKYVDKWQPAYRMLADLPLGEREAATAFLVEATDQESPPLPTTIITDGAGGVLEIMSGVPTVSQIRKVLHR